MAKLTDKQYAAIEYLSVPKRGGLTYEQVAEEVGVHVDTLLNWRRKDDFNNALNRRIIQKTQDRMPEVFDAAIDGIILDKNAAIFRTFLQAHGLLTERHEVEARTTGSVDVDAIRARMSGKDTETGE
ncbi:phBC6A51 family helix-turn-helix protein [Sporosarcina koreensis]|uniref:phBC6A51 family helix-turn-helix protein n=1 Tax=Sporosarcina koreensis TaxID=334735 RepID=UPI000751C1C2|nr:phBC6A51 family helix-turn-helix protein [Sporosarcina koreensis]